MGSPVPPTQPPTPAPGGGPAMTSPVDAATAVGLVADFPDAWRDAAPLQIPSIKESEKQHPNHDHYSKNPKEPDL